LGTIILTLGKKNSQRYEKFRFSDFHSVMMNLKIKIEIIN